MLSLPFNSSTAIVYWNKEAFTKAGLDPEKPPKTWPETFAVAKKLRQGGANCGVVPAWISWTQLEQFNSWHNLPLATKANGLDGPDAELVFNTPTMAKHIAALAEAIQEKSIDYGGRGNDAERGVPTGQCGGLGTLVQIRDAIAEQLEATFAGKTEPKAALDNAAARGNAILRQFQKTIQ